MADKKILVMRTFLVIIVILIEFFIYLEMKITPNFSSKIFLVSVGIFILIGVISIWNKIKNE